jgi:hypothetical protein
LGKLTYDSTMTVDFDDRTLSHLQVVIGAKLRQGESFLFTWRDDPAIGDGRTTIWLHPSLPLGFKYYEPQPPLLNRAWIEALMVAANSSGGLHVVPEPTPAARESGHGTQRHRFHGTPGERRQPARASAKG